MPKGYVIAHLTLKDKERFFNEYGSKIEAVVGQFGGKFLVRGGEVLYREGETISDIDVIVEFPDKEAGQNCLKSDAYQQIIAGRLDNTTGTFIFVEGV